MRLIELRGIVEDGRRRAAGLPPATSNGTTIAMQRGEPVTVRVQVVYPDLTPVALTGDATFTLRKATGQPDTYPGVTTAEDISGDTVDFVLDAQATDGVNPGRWLFDVWWTPASGERVCLVPTSGCVILPSVTRAPPAD